MPRKARPRNPLQPPQAREIAPRIKVALAPNNTLRIPVIRKVPFKQTPWPDIREAVKSIPPLRSSYGLLEFKPVDPATFPEEDYGRLVARKVMRAILGKQKGG